jgi:ligand-binding sensor protein
MTGFDDLDDGWDSVAPAPTSVPTNGRYLARLVRIPLCANMRETPSPSEFCVEVDCQGGAAPSEASS